MDARCQSSQSEVTREKQSHRVMISQSCVVKKENDWVKKCMEYEVKGSIPTGRPKKE